MHNLRPSFEHSLRKTRNCFVQDSFLSNLVAHKRLSPRSKHSPLLATQKSIINIRVAEPQIAIDRKFRTSLYQTSLRRLKKQHIKSSLEDPPKINMISPTLQEQLVRQKGKRYSQIKHENTISLEVNETDASIFSILEPRSKRNNSRRNLDLIKRKFLFKNFQEQSLDMSQQKSVLGRVKASNQYENSPSNTLMLQTYSPPAIRIKSKYQSYIQPFEKGLEADRKLPSVLYRSRDPVSAYKSFSSQQKKKQKIKEKQLFPKEKTRLFSSRFDSNHPQ